MYRISYVLVSLLTLLGTFSAFAQHDHHDHPGRTCHAHEKHLHFLEVNPAYRAAQEAIELQTQNYANRARTHRIEESTIVIPVVVHVIYSNSNENISTAQIQSQIDVLNADFRRLNGDRVNTPSTFAGVAADINIEFVLANTDPNGNPTSGITRKSSSRTSWGTNDEMKSASNGGVNAWDTDKYLNMWVCNIGGGILGYAQFPGGPASTDGVVMSPQYFGSSAGGSGFYLSAPFDKGRTTTHEVGHWLNLRHIWGDGNCSADDFVSDTPNAGAPNYGCPSHPSTSCSSADMFMNYMDYVDDNCMNMFTEGQKTRMRALFAPGGARESFASNTGGGSGGGGSTAPTYCTSQGNDATYEWIAQVNFGSFTNNSAGASYTDFTSSTVNLSEGANSVSFTPGFSGQAYNEHWKVWIDFNEDGDFTDAGEEVFSQGLSNTTVSGTLTIPAGNAGTTTRMRVSMKYDGTQTSCESFSYGEVEDYTVSISGGAAPSCDTPTGLSSSNVTSSSFTLSWGAVSGATDYEVRVRQAGTTSWSNLTASTNSLTVSNLAASTTYEWQVRTNCASSNSSYSNSATVTTPAPPCNTPTSLSSSNVTTSSFTMSWGAVSGATGYQVRVRPSGTTSWTTYAASTNNLTVNSGIASGTTYQWQVRTNCSSNNSSYSSTATVTTLTPAPGCAAPTGLGSSNVTTDAFTLFWDAVSGATDYEVRLRALGSTTWYPFTASTNSLSLSGAAANTSYEWQVRTNCSGTNSDYSSLTTVTTLGAALTYCDSKGNSTSDEWINAFSFNGQTNTSGNNGGYADFTGTVFSVNKGGSYNITITPAWAGTVYREAYAIWVDFNQDGDFTDAGEQVYSRSRTNASSVSGTVSIPNSALSGNTRMRVSMKYNANPTACETFSYGEVEDYTLNIAGATRESAGLENLSVETVQSEMPESFSVEVFPNPAREFVNLHFVGTDEAAEVELLNLSGQVLRQVRAEGQTRLDLQRLPTGMYILRVRYGQQVETHKIVKQ